MEVVRGLGCYGEKVLLMVVQHHEKYDGEAYHQDLASEDTSLFAKICKLTDVYYALNKHRSYKRSLKTMGAFIIM